MSVYHVNNHNSVTLWIEFTQNSRLIRIFYLSGLSNQEQGPFPGCLPAAIYSVFILCFSCNMLCHSHRCGGNTKADGMIYSWIPACGRMHECSSVGGIFLYLRFDKICANKETSPDSERKAPEKNTRTCPERKAPEKITRISAGRKEADQIIRICPSVKEFEITQTTQKGGCHV